MNKDKPLICKTCLAFGYSPKLAFYPEEAPGAAVMIWRKASDKWSAYSRIEGFNFEIICPKCHTVVYQKTPDNYAIDTAGTTAFEIPPDPIKRLMYCGKCKAEGKIQVLGARTQTGILVRVSDKRGVKSYVAVKGSAFAVFCSGCNDVAAFQRPDQDSLTISTSLSYW